MPRIIFHIDVNSAFLSWTAVKMVREGKPDIRLIPCLTTRIDVLPTTMLTVITYEVQSVFSRGFRENVITDNIFVHSEQIDNSQSI